VRTPRPQSGVGVPFTVHPPPPHGRLRGISGLAYAGGERYYAVSDRGALFTLSVEVSGVDGLGDEAWNVSVDGGHVALHVAEATNSRYGGVEAEGVAVCRGTSPRGAAAGGGHSGIDASDGFVLVSTENPPLVARVATSNGQEAGSASPWAWTVLRVPRVTVTTTTANRQLEPLACFQPTDGPPLIFTAAESPLLADSANASRIFALNAHDGRLLRTTLYELEPVPGNGLVSIVVLNSSSATDHRAGGEPEFSHPLPGV
jgi:hypothetical protein